MKKRFYFLSIFILFLININSVYSATYTPEEFDAQLYDNSNGTLSSVTTQFNPHSGGSWYSGFIPLVANSSGGAWGITSPVIFTSGHTYAFSARVFTGCGSVKLSTYNRIGIGTSLSQAVSNYSNDLYVKEMNSDYNNYNYIQFAFESQTNGTYIVFPFATNVSGSNCEIQLSNISITDLGNSGVSEEEINQSLQAQTNDIENSISQSTNDIKGSISNTEDSLKGSISNTEDSINSTIKDTFETCEQTKNLFKKNQFVRYLSPNGDGLLLHDVNADLYYLRVRPNSTYTLSSNVNRQWVLTTCSDIPREGLQCSPRIIATGFSYTLTIPNNRTYLVIRHYPTISENNINQNIQVELGSNATSYEDPTCKNKLDSLNDTQKETNEKLDDLNDNITNSDSTEASGEASDFFSNFNTDTFGLTSVITAPLELIKSVTSKSCTPLQGTLPFVNTDVNLPCLSTIYESHFGTFLNIYRTITFGFVSYWVCIKIFNLVKDFKNPEHDEIEVLDL